MTVLAFVDTNVVVYAVGRDTDRREKAIRLLTDGAVVSAQVINEMVSVLVGKQKFVLKICSMGKFLKVGLPSSTHSSILDNHEMGKEGFAYHFMLGI